MPFFRKLLEGGTKSLPITDPRMTRFWITLQQGVNFVLSSLELMQGGEIFVPKIPSMKVVDLATAMAPNLKHEVVGIRPGEKLHEVMITNDDARSTVELDDRYVICPGFNTFEQGLYEKIGAQPMANGFSYCSETNREWLSAEKLMTILSMK